ncbi:MAG TPA: ferritin family protein [Candidatus Mcinerneyibacterium sp.]|nr:ferritin family protein [Candidatus Mcinerneyibacterium sp.]
MSKESVLKGLKKGMKGELDSISLYKQAAEKSSGDVKDFFEERVEEEKMHYNYLLDFYKSIDAGKSIKKISDEFPTVEEETSPIISEKFIDRISDKQHLFSAISTAVLLELESIKLYDKWADQADDADLSNFYKKLADWEREHYNEVTKIEKEAEEEFWVKNRFSPF